MIINNWFICGIVLILGMSISMCFSVGDVAERQIYGWSLPATVFIMMGGMFAIGYKANIEKEKEN